MKTLRRTNNSQRHEKLMILAGLYTFAAAITLSGIIFAVFCLLKNDGAKVPGMLLGSMVIYFGVRSIFLVKAFQPKLLQKDSRFSWDNFRKAKKAKSR